MNDRDISNSFIEIIAGTNNRVHPSYMEAVKSVEETSSKAMSQLKNFITSIEKVANKENVKDSRITKSKGNIKQFTAYEDIKTSMEFLRKTLGSISVIKDLNIIFDALEDYQPQYTEGYEKNIRLVILEYESAVDLLVTGLSMTMAECIDVVQTGTEIKIQKKSGSTSGIIHKTISDLAKQLGNKHHKEYLNEMNKSKTNAKISTNIEESVSFMESAVSDTVELIDTMFDNIGKIRGYARNILRSIKNSVFGIVPLIRSCLYLRYKKKADTILALEQQAEFINQNIEILKNRTNVDPKEKEQIIKKQQAIAEAYKKKAAKLRAELSDGEREAAVAIKAEDPKMKDDDDDFVLESNGIDLSVFNKND